MKVGEDSVGRRDVSLPGQGREPAYLEEFARNALSRGSILLCVADTILREPVGREEFANAYREFFNAAGLALCVEDYCRRLGCSVDQVRSVYSGELSALEDCMTEFLGAMESMRLSRAGTGRRSLLCVIDGGKK